MSEPSVARIAEAQERFTDIGKNEACGLVERVDVASNRLSIQLNASALAKFLESDLENNSSVHLNISVPFRIRRRGVEAKLIIGADSTAPDQTLIQAIAHAFVWLEDIKSGDQVRDIAERYGKAPNKLLLRLRLAFLSPRIIQAILGGKQPPELTLTRLMKMKIPSDWDDQWRELGFASVP